MAEKINRNVRYKIWELFYEGYTAKEIARVCTTTDRHVTNVINEFRRAESATAKARNSSMILSNKSGILRWIENNRAQVSSFALFTKNEKVLELAKRLGFLTE